MTNMQSSKFIPISLPDKCVERKKLVSHIERLTEKKIILVSAPAGSGKSVSILQWMQGSNRRIVWIGLDSFDNSTAIFYRLLCTGVLSTQAGNENAQAILRDPAFNSSPVEQTIRVLTDLAANKEPCALILDDYHTITNHEILRSLPFILRRLPLTFVTFVLSRQAPDDDFAKLLEAGNGALVGQCDLAFSEDEVKRYFIAFGRKKEEAEIAYAFTGGWAMGVNALAHSAAPVPQGHGDQILDNYIKNNIWAEWDDETREFMLLSGALDEMPLPLCEDITGRVDAGELLEKLQASNVFVDLIEDGVYRYHHLFLDFLRAQPEYLMIDHRLHWHEAAKFYFLQKEYLPAQRYAYKSGDTDLLLSIWDELLNNMNRPFEEYLTFSRELIQSEEISELCKKSPVLYIFCARTAFLYGDARLFEINIDNLRRNLGTILQKYPRFGELAFALLILNYKTPIAKHLMQIDKLPGFDFIDFPGDEIRVSTISLHMPFFHRSSRDYCELADLSLYELSPKAFGKLLRGHFDLAKNCVKSGISLEQNRLNDALTEAQASISLLAPWVVKEVRFAAYMHLIAVYRALGRESEFTALLEETRVYVNNDALCMLPNFRAYETRVELWNGKEDAARKWLDNYFVAETQPLETYRIYQYFTTVRAYGVLGDFAKGKDLVARLRRLAQEFNRPQDAAEAGVLLAAFLWAEGHKDAAQEMLETVLLEMQPYSFIRLFADEGAAILPVLKRVEGKVGHADYQGELDGVYVNNVYLAAYAVSKQQAGILGKRKTTSTKLSKQQKNILQLLSQGHKRSDIVEMTGLSLSTIKTHISQIYEKLGVNNAADAVHRAAELKIFE